MNWGEFAKASPELARLGWERFERHELCMVGTLRRSGWPRISPCELDLVGDTSDRNKSEGDFWAQRPE